MRSIFKNGILLITPLFIYIIGSIFNNTVITVLFGSIIIFFLPGFFILNIINIESLRLYKVQLSIIISIIIINSFLILILQFNLLTKNMIILSYIIIYLCEVFIILFFSKNMVINFSFNIELIIIMFFSILLWYYITINTTHYIVPSQDIYDYILRTRYYMNGSYSHDLFGSDFYPYLLGILETAIAYIWDVDLIKAFSIMELLFTILSTYSIFIFTCNIKKDKIYGMINSLLLLSINGFGWIHTFFHPYNSTMGFVLTNFSYFLILTYKETKEKIIIYLYLLLSCLIFFTFPYILPIYFVISFIIYNDFILKFNIYNVIILVLIVIVSLFFGNILLTQLENVGRMMEMVFYNPRKYSYNTKLTILYESYNPLIMFLFIYSIIKKISKSLIDNYFLVLLVLMIGYFMPLSHVHRIEQFFRTFIIILSSDTLFYIINFKGEKIYV